MRRKILYPLTAFVVVFILHATYSIWRAIQISKQWVQIEDMNFLLLYFARKDFFLGLSYALAASFTIYALLKFLSTGRRGVGGVLGGVTLTGVLYFSGCFLMGCCGSPLLVVYLSLFGSSFLGFTKPLVLILTVSSVIIGYFWIEKKTRMSTSCSVGNEKCKGGVI